MAKEVRDQLEVELKGKLPLVAAVNEDYERFSERAKRSMPIDLDSEEKFANLT